jgi:DnaJ-class molecular chaperone
MFMDDTRVALEVELELTVLGKKFIGLGKLTACPFCQNKDGDKEACGMCEGTGIIIKLKKAPQAFKLFVIPGGKK